MKLLLDIKDNKLEAFLKLLVDYSNNKPQTISKRDSDLFDEIKEIKTALKHADLIKQGKLKVKPLEVKIQEKESVYP